MSQEIIVPFDDHLLRLPSCLLIHKQLRSNLNQLTSNNYVELIKQLCQTNQSHLCGIIRKIQSDIIILGLAFYRIHLTTFDTIRFEIHDLIIDENERNHGLGTRLFHYLIDQAKQCEARSIVLQCDLINTNAHRFFFRHGLTITSFGFYMNEIQLLKINNQIQIIDITNIEENENEKFLIQSQNIFRQLRPHLSNDKNEFINQIRNICQTGPAQMIIAINNDDRNEILGLAIYRISHTIKYSTHIYCDDLVTDENKRSLGVGRCLMNYMKNEVQKFGFNRIALDSGCSRGRTHKFYYREGFHLDQFKFSILF